MTKRPRSKKKTLEEASTSNIERTKPHLDGFHSETPEVRESIEKTRLYHTRYLRPINSPLRREILRTLKESCKTIEDLQSKTGLSREKLEWHLSVLERGFCIEKDVEGSKVIYRLTQEGKVVDYME